MYVARHFFDGITSYNLESMTERKWLRRILFLETVAGMALPAHMTHESHTHNETVITDALERYDRHAPCCCYRRIAHRCSRCAKHTVVTGTHFVVIADTLKRPEKQKTSMHLTVPISKIYNTITCLEQMYSGAGWNAASREIRYVHK